ncbi:MAG: ArsR family transcriptional regulator [Lentisphaerae bacterium]|nr:ArsR family transcriptional regulator [Lentisphaerota bacterium]
MLQPTLWRTCRVLANKTRLQILQAVLRKPGLSVSEVARQLHLRVSLASKYLRELNARGLLRATRKSAEVCYWPEADRSLPQASVLLRALVATWHTQRSPIDFIFRVATAFTHHRRIAIIRELARQPAQSNEIRRHTGISRIALKRHLDKLLHRGFVRLSRTDGVYSVASSHAPLKAALLRLAGAREPLKRELRIHRHLGMPRR